MASATAPPSELALPRPRPLRWLSARPRVADVAVIVACLLPSLLALVVAPPAHTWAGYVCAAGVATALWWRRYHPVAVALVVVALAALSPVSFNSISVGLVESVFVLYALGSYTRARTAIGGYLLTEVVIVSGCALTIWLGLRETWPGVIVQPAGLAALALGIAARASRSRRVAVDQLVSLREERAAAAERARITAEMHDVVAHSVTVMVALAGGAAAGWDKHPERARQALDQLGTVGAHTLEEMGRILRLLRDGDRELGQNLESSGLNVPSLAELVDGFRGAGLPVVFSSEPKAGVERVLGADPALATTVYRIVQESLTNTVRHARSVTHVEVEVTLNDGRLDIRVTDNGQAATVRPGGGMGLRAMRERAAAFGGLLQAGPVPQDEQGPGSGWHVRVDLPVSAGAS